MRKRKSAPKLDREVAEERDEIVKSDCYRRNSCRLLGPVEGDRAGILIVKILKFAKQRLTRDDFLKLCEAIKDIERLSWDCAHIEHRIENRQCPAFPVCESLGFRIAHSCRLQTEIMGLLCAVLPYRISQSSALGESHQALRSVREFHLCCKAGNVDLSKIFASKEELSYSLISKRAKISSRPFLRSLLFSLHSDAKPAENLLPEEEHIDFQKWKSKTDPFFPSYIEQNS